MVAAFSGKKYKLESSDKFDEYMAALGVGVVTRKMACGLHPVMELVVNGDDYTLKSSSTFKNLDMTFKLGKEVDHETADGRKVKTTFTLEGNKLIEMQKGDKATKIIREFSATEVKCTLTVDDIVCIRVYKAC